MDRPRSASLAGRPKLSIRRTDGRSQRGLLADNLAANAADMVEAAHCGGEWASASGQSRAASGPAPAPGASSPTVGPEDSRPVWLSCPSHIPANPANTRLRLAWEGVARLGAP